MDVQARVVNYFKNNSFIKKYLKGIDAKTNEVVLVYKNENRRMTIDKLERINTEEELLISLDGGIINEKPVTVNEPVIETPTETPMVDNSINNNIPNNVSPVVENTVVEQKTLNDVAILTELKNKDGLDNVLKEFAINKETGLIDFKVAMDKVISNTIREVESSIINKTEYSIDATKYDIQGNYIGEKVALDSSPDEKIMKGFQNINIYLNASKMYPEQVNFDPSGIEIFKNNYIAKVKTDLGLNAPVKTESAPKKQLVLENPEQKNAGFADIFVLTVIVLVYAAIIINLIFKLK